MCSKKRSKIAVFFMCLRFWVPGRPRVAHGFFQGLKIEPKGTKMDTREALKCLKTMSKRVVFFMRLRFWASGRLRVAHGFFQGVKIEPKGTTMDTREALKEDENYENEGNIYRWSRCEVFRCCIVVLLFCLVVLLCC